MGKSGVRVGGMKRSFRRDRRGNVAMIFAGALVGVVGVTGLAIDYGRAFAYRTALQSSLDMALLKAANEVGLKEADMATVLPTYLAQNWVETRYDGSTPTVGDVSTVDDLFVANANAAVPTSFLGALGYQTIDVGVTSKVSFGLGDAEIVMVLDNTGSMTGWKLDELKLAAGNLVDTLSDAVPKEDALKVGIVPFGKYVNVGLDNRDASWMDVPPDYSETTNQCSTNRTELSRDNCRTDTVTIFVDGFPTTSTREVCDVTYGDDEDEQCSDYTYTYTWHGCVGSRSHPLDVWDEQPGKRFPGILNVGCPSAITPLTSDVEALKVQINAMFANGNTYIPAGLAWGWRVLSHKMPYAEGMAYGAAKRKNTRKIIVLMTDGQNTASPEYPLHNGVDTSLADSRTAELCTNIKAEGIEIFTLTFDVTDNSVKQLMEDCASGEPYYFDATGASNLAAAFEKIGQSLISLRLAG